MQTKAELLVELSGGIFLRPHLSYFLLSPSGSPGDTLSEPSWQALGPLNPSLRPLPMCKWGLWVMLPDGGRPSTALSPLRWVPDEFSSDGEAHEKNWLLLGTQLPQPLTECKPEMLRGHRWATSGWPCPPLTEGGGRIIPNAHVPPVRTPFDVQEEEGREQTRTRPSACSLI